MYFKLVASCKERTTETMSWDSATQKALQDASQGNSPANTSNWPAAAADIYNAVFNANKK